MQKRVPEEATIPRTLRDCTHFFYVAKKAAPEGVCICFLSTRASEKPSKKSVKFLERGPGGEPLPAAWALKTDGI